MGLATVYRNILQRFEATDVFKHVAVYNKQIQRYLRGEEFFIDFPACYVEINEKNVYELGNLMSVSDLEVTFHIAMMELDSADGMLDQNLNIFKLRNTVKALFSLFKIDNGGCFNWLDEEQDYNHGNLYHYTLTYVVHAIDLTAVPDEYELVLDRVDYAIWNLAHILWNNADQTWDNFQLPVPLTIDLNIQPDYE